ncbi:thioredoxin domain-containing protein [Paenibacillus sp. GCM10027627]|uniref:thioredoxin domain-containing protein n=1 Tax=unclassified Paenibacillus TaxID=185978 RepID=UPI0036427A89
MSSKKSAKSGGSRYFVLYTAIIIVIGVALFLINQQSNKKAEENVELESAPETVAQPLMGDANAKVKIVEFGDYKCPSCKAWGETVWPKLKADYIDTGKANFSYINVLFHGEESKLAALASESMLKLHPDQFWDFHKKLYDAQPQVDHDGLWVTEEKIMEVAKSAVPDLDEKQLKETMATEEAGKLVNLDEILVKQFGIQQTPTLMIGDIVIADPFNYDTIKSAIELKLK